MAQQPSIARTPKRSRRTTVIVTGTRTAKAVDKIPGAVNVINAAEVANSLALAKTRRRAGARGAWLRRVDPGHEQHRREPARPHRAAPVRRHSAGLAAARNHARSGSFTDLGVVGASKSSTARPHPKASARRAASSTTVQDAHQDGQRGHADGASYSQFKDDSAGWKLGANYATRPTSGTSSCWPSREVDRGMTYDATAAASA
jgi:iron complex outermembrane receptor protein